MSMCQIRARGFVVVSGNAKSEVEKGNPESVAREGGWADRAYIYSRKYVCMFVKPHKESTEKKQAKHQQRRSTTK